MHQDSGTLKFVDDCVVYESATYGTWRLEASSIRLIGECTNQSGPSMDDYFLVFVKRGANDWCEASFYAAGREETIQALAQRFPGMAALGLAASTDFASRVLWPAEHRAKPLFDHRPMRRGNRWHQRVLDCCFPPAATLVELRAEFKGA